MNLYDINDIPEHLQRFFEPAPQLGLEPTFQEYINKLLQIFDEVYRILKSSGTVWINLGDAYSSGNRVTEDLKHHGFGTEARVPYLRPNRNGCGVSDKSLCLIPSRFAIGMLDNGWILRNTIVWHKPNCMPSSAKDRLTVDFEYVFFFVKSKKYWFETQYEPYISSYNNYEYMGNAMKNYNSARAQNPSDSKRRILKSMQKNDGRIKRTTWTITTQSFSGCHFAVFPEALIETPIQAGCPVGGVVLDPFIGSGTTAVVARKQQKNYIGIDLNEDYCKIAEKRLMEML